MSSNFDIKPIDRRGTGSIKWDFCKEFTGYDKQMIPMWVADMDFEIPHPVTEAIMERAGHHLFGYTEREADYYESIKNWFRKRHNWNIENDHIRFSPGVIPALNAIVQGFSDPGDGIIVQTPVYYPFMTAVTNNKRELKLNTLKESNGEYTIDFDHLESLIDNRTKILILCNPHNPVGRVWKKEELRKIAEIAIKHKIFVVADEIHCDIITGDIPYTPFATVLEGVENFTITCTSPSKTFNLAGLQVSNIIFQNRDLYDRFDKQMFANGLHLTNSFGIGAVIAAYNHCEPWLNNLIEYINKNYEILDSFISGQLRDIRLSPLEGTYLGWMDFRSTGLTEDEVNKRLMDKAGVWLEKGSTFGDGGEGFQRINLGTSHGILEEALKKIAEVF